MEPTGRRYTLTVPQQLNDGTPMATAARETIEAHILHTFDGFTAHDARGAWQANDGVIYRDPVTVYTFDDHDPGPQVAREVQWLAAYVRDILKQEAVYVTASPIYTLLV